MHIALRLLGVCLLLGAAACQPPVEADPSAQPEERTTLVVINEHIGDVDIHTVRSGLVTRLGRVNAGRTQRFALSAAITGSSNVSFLATTTLGAREQVSSGSLTLLTGRTVQFRIAPVLNQSSAFVQ